MTRFCFILLISLIASAGHASDCNTFVGQSGLKKAEVTPFQFQFDSGAVWELCWHVDEHAGLVLSDVYYGVPNQQPVQVLDSASIAQIIFKYDEDEEVDARHLLSKPGLGGTQHLPLAGNDCSGELLVGNSGQQICQQFYLKNLMTKVRHSEPIQRHEISLHAHTRIGEQNFDQVWRLSEDGEITPSMVYSGRLTRYTKDFRYGTKLSGIDQYAASATLLVNWRLDFNINSTPANDVVDEIEFVVPAADPSKRTISVSSLNTETSRKISGETFRGWRVSDAKYSSGVNTGSIATTRAGYYLDPQSAAYRLSAGTEPWSEFDFFVTVKRECEQLASKNTLANANCAEGLHTFINDENLTDADTVVWFSLSRQFLPRKEDYPAISAMEIGFKLIPFDWSAFSPFEPPDASVELVPAGDQ